MSEFVLECPHCGQSLEGSSELCGQSISCPSCNGQIDIPELDSAEPETSAASPETPASVCRGCQAPLEADAVICIQCGTNQKTGEKLRTEFEQAAKDAPPPPPKSPPAPAPSRTGKDFTPRGDKGSGPKPRS